MATISPLRGRPTELTGRRSERDVLDRLIQAVRGGESRALVVQGEPGVGKTALLEYIVERASGCRVEQGSWLDYAALSVAAVSLVVSLVLGVLNRRPPSVPWICHKGRKTAASHGWCFT